MSTSRQVTGRLGEDLAVEFLVKKGYTILERNVRTRFGEIDLVALQKEKPTTHTNLLESQVLVFVEVKTRRSTSFGYPEESVTAVKQAHMLASARAYLSMRSKWGGDWRMDVVAVRLNGAGSADAEIEHFENVIP